MSEYLFLLYDLQPFEQIEGLVELIILLRGQFAARWFNVLAVIIGWFVLGSRGLAALRLRRGCRAFVAFLTVFEVIFQINFAYPHGRRSAGAFLYNDVRIDTLGLDGTAGRREIEGCGELDCLVVG